MRNKKLFWTNFQFKEFFFNNCYYFVYLGLLGHSNISVLYLGGLSTIEN